MAKHHETIKQRSPFLALPYEIRHLIYSALFPIGHEISVDGNDLTQITRGHGPLRTLWAYPSYETNFLLACRIINEEVTTLYYGSNAFTIIPGTGVYYIPPIRCEIFVAQLRPETASKVKKIHIFLGPGIDESFLGGLIPGIARFPHVEISITRLRLLPEIFLLEKRILVEQACRLIAGARSGAETVWDARGEKDNIEMLHSIIPNGYQRKK